METYIKELLDNNESWVQEQLAMDPEFFRKSAEGQAPKVLWVGCSDSRYHPMKLRELGKASFLYTEILPI